MSNKPANQDQRTVTFTEFYTDSIGNTHARSEQVKVPAPGESKIDTFFAGIVLVFFILAIVGLIWLFNR